MIEWIGIGFCFAAGVFLFVLLVRFWRFWPQVLGLTAFVVFVVVPTLQWIASEPWHDWTQSEKNYVTAGIAAVFWFVLMAREAIRQLFMG